MGAVSDCMGGSAGVSTAADGQGAEMSDGVADSKAEQSFCIAVSDLFEIMGLQGQIFQKLPPLLAGAERVVNREQNPVSTQHLER